MKIISRIRDFLYVVADYAFVLILGILLCLVCWNSYHRLLSYAEREVPVEEIPFMTGSEPVPALGVQVLIPEGTTVSQLADLLSSCRVLDETKKSVFIRYFNDHLGEDLIQSGTYTFGIHTPFDQLLEAVRAPKPDASTPAAPLENSSAPEAPSSMSESAPNRESDPVSSPEAPASSSQAPNASSEALPATNPEADTPDAP